ncbi:MAG: hypothetical protein BVN32_01410 [Proteobacteria bacterium ST_bin14]|nr:MAG: hypothetical protein BVN32_01410 [Proteobacteria bacterium ST_bin14]
MTAISRRTLSTLETLSLPLELLAIKPTHPSPLGEGPGVGAISLTETNAPWESPHPNPSPKGEGLESATK